ncbi:MAG: CHAT domain-containing protein, partial [Holophagales bacterium]|nr:CHAT domain-containing protein [Holophagales bacterium]
MGMLLVLASVCQGPARGMEPGFQVSLCAEILDGPVCVLGPERKLRIFVAHQAGAEVSLRPAPETGPTVVVGGSRYELRIPEGAGRLWVEVRGGGEAGEGGRDRGGRSARRHHSLALAAPEPEPDWYRHALALYRQNHLETALEIVERHGRGRGDPGVDRRPVDGSTGEGFGVPLGAVPARNGEAGRVAGRALALELAYRIHQRRGERQRADEALLAAVLAYRESGRWASASRQLSNLFYLRLQARRFAACRELGELWPRIPEDGDSAFQEAYYGALLASKTGELRSALDRVRRARRIASRLDRERYRAAAENLMATVLQGLGRHRGARRLLECAFRARAGRMSACERAQYLNAFAWSLILEQEARGTKDPGRVPGRGLDDGGACGPGTDSGEPTSAELALLLRGEPRAILEVAHELLIEQCPGLPLEPFNVRMNLAMVELQEGRHEAAGRTLEQVRRELAEPPGDLVAWDWELRGRIALLAGEARAALGFYEQLSAFSAAASWPEGEWRAALGRARALEALQRPDDALAAYGAADRQLDWELLWVPIYLGREDLVALRAEAAVHHLELLLSLGRRQEALDLARRQRARTWHHLSRAVSPELSDPEARRGWEAVLGEYHARREQLEARLASSWALPAEHLLRLRAEAEQGGAELRSRLDASLARREGLDSVRLRSPGAGELMSAAFRGSRGWWLFAWDSEGISTHHSTRLDALLLELSGVEAEARPEASGAAGELGAALARELLAPFAPRLRRARRLSWMPPGRLRQVDLHSLPFDGAPLAHLLPVAYSLDLPLGLSGAQPGDAAASGPALASDLLLVSDPGGDLPHARAEAAAVLELSGAVATTAVTHLEGLAATGSETRRWLARRDHFHYSGHARFAGWDSHLPLAEGSSLTVDDILALPRAPARVVLAGCESGRPLTPGGRETLGLAQAFVVRGSREVIAATRPVPDEDGRRLMEALYRVWASSAPETGAVDAAEALRRAQQQ